MYRVKSGLPVELGGGGDGCSPVDGLTVGEMSPGTARYEQAALGQ